jgi:hypothetical protein
MFIVEDSEEIIMNSNFIAVRTVCSFCKGLYLIHIVYGSCLYIT